MQERVYAWGNRRGPEGWTDAELDVVVNEITRTVRPRRRKLYIDRRVIWTGRKRKNPSGRAANVWVTDQVAREHGIQPVPIPVNDADQIAFLLGVCEITGPDGEPIRSGSELRETMDRYFSTLRPDEKKGSNSGKRGVTPK